MAHPIGLEPMTYGLEGRCCYPTELRAHRIKLQQLLNRKHLIELTLKHRYQTAQD